MNAIVISRNVHPYERGAFYLAKEVDKRIKGRGIESHLLTVPYEVSSLYFLRRLHRYQISKDELEGWKLDSAMNWLREEIECHYPDSVHFDFHNTRVESFNPKNKGPEDIPIKFSKRPLPVISPDWEGIPVFPHFRKGSYVIELPAVYRLCPRKRVDEFNELISRGYGSLIDNQEKEMVDVRRTRESGWMSEVLRDRLVDWMLRFATDPTPITSLLLLPYQT